MKKIVIDRPGGYDHLRIEQASTPSPGPDEVLVDVAAIGVNYADCIIRMGLYASARKYVGYPITPGFEVSGTVAATGSGITDLSPGARVIGVTRFGGYATRLCLPRPQVFPLPDALTTVEAAAFPTVFLTAWFALHEQAHPQPGAHLLVHSAAGGVGSALVQLGKRAGCRVVGVVGAPHKVDVARRLGADAVVDKSADDLWATAEKLAPQGYDVVLDANGVSTLKESYRHLAPMGKLVIYGFHSMLPRAGARLNILRLARDYLRMPRFNPLKMTGDNKSVLAFNLSYLFDQNTFLQRAMDDLLNGLADGSIRPPDVTTYPFEAVADAHRDLESGQTAGKLVLVVDSQGSCAVS